MDLIVASKAHYDVQDCTFIDPRNQQAIYRVHAERSSIFSPPNTSITRFVSDRGETNVAVIEWSTFGKAKVRYSDGRLVDSSQLLEKHGLGRRYTFTGADSRTYAWKLERHGCSLEAGGHTIAQYHEKHRGLVGLFASGPNDSRFSVATPALDMLDLIVLTWAIVERRRQIRKELAKSAGG